MAPNSSLLRIPPQIPFPFLSPLRSRTSLPYRPTAAGPRNHASSKVPPYKPPKPRVLAKPDRFNPPSHSARRVKPQLPLPPLSPKQVEERRTKRYPGMRFHQGTWSHWFLTTRWIHLCLTLSTLAFFATYTAINNFQKSTPYYDLLPSIDTFARHPIQFLKGYFHVWKITVDYQTEVARGKRERNLEDLEKRKKYRKAHGLDHSFWFFGWGLEGLRDGVFDDGKGEGKDGGDGKKNENENETGVGSASGSGSGEIKSKKEEVWIDTAPENSREGGRGRRSRIDDGRMYVDWDGKRKPVKTWLGIW